MRTMRAIIVAIAVGLVLLTPALVRADEYIWNPPTKLETTLFVASEVLIAVDFIQTRDWFMRGCPKEAYSCEANPILGDKPSVEKLLVYNASVAAVNGAMWYWLLGYQRVGKPHNLRTIWSSAFIIVELPVVTHNAMIGAKFRW